MNTIDALHNEVLVEIFTYLEDSDIYSCLFVNRLFNEHTIPFLYRSIVWDDYRVGGPPFPS